MDLEDAGDQCKNILGFVQNAYYTVPSYIDNSGNSTMLTNYAITSTLATITAFNTSTNISLYNNNNALMPNNNGTSGLFRINIDLGIGYTFAFSYLEFSDYNLRYIYMVQTLLQVIMIYHLVVERQIAILFCWFRLQLLIYIQQIQPIYIDIFMYLLTTHHVQFNALDFLLVQSQLQILFQVLIIVLIQTLQVVIQESKI